MIIQKNESLTADEERRNKIIINWHLRFQFKKAGIEPDQASIDAFIEWFNSNQYIFLEGHVFFLHLFAVAETRYPSFIPLIMSLLNLNPHHPSKPLEVTEDVILFMLVLDGRLPAHVPLSHLRVAEEIPPNGFSQNDSTSYTQHRLEIVYRLLESYGFRDARENYKIDSEGTIWHETVLHLEQERTRTYIQVFTAQQPLYQRLQQIPVIREMFMPHPENQPADFIPDGRLKSPHQNNPR